MTRATAAFFNFFFERCASVSSLAFASEDAKLSHTVRKKSECPTTGVYMSGPKAMVDALKVNSRLLTITLDGAAGENSSRARGESAHSLLLRASLAF